MRSSSTNLGLPGLPPEMAASHTKRLLTGLPTMAFNCPCLDARKGEGKENLDLAAMLFKM